MFKHYLILLFLMFSTLAIGQGWERVYAGGGQDEIRGIALTPDGGFVMAGYYNLSKLLLIKADADGDLQWSKNFSATGHDVAGATAIIATRDSGYAIAGFVRVGSAPDSPRDLYLFKTDAHGNILWERTFGGPQNDEAKGLVELADGSLVVVGFTTNFLEPVTGDWTEDVFLAKTDVNGNELWTKSVGQPLFKERGNGIVLAPNGDLVVAGWRREQQSVPGDRDFYAARLDSDGNLLWSNTYGFSGLDDEARAIAIASDVLMAEVTSKTAFWMISGSASVGKGREIMLIPLGGN